MLILRSKKANARNWLTWRISCCRQAVIVQFFMPQRRKGLKFFFVASCLYGQLIFQFSIFLANLRSKNSVSCILFKSRNMIMRSFIIIICIGLVQFSFKPFPGGPGDYAPTIKKQVEAMGQALVKKDFDTY